MSPAAWRELVGRPGRRRVYVAGPLSAGNTLENVRRAILVGKICWRAGLAPVVPHLNALWALVDGAQPHDFWLELDLEWLRACDAVIRLVGVSPGADREVEAAVLLGIPVFREERYPHLPALLTDLRARFDG